MSNKDFQCGQCGHSQYTEKTVLLNTRLASFVGLDWLNEQAAVKVCRSCGFLHWYVIPVEQKKEELICCKACNSEMAWGDMHCRKCGEKRPADDLY